MKLISTLLATAFAILPRPSLAFELKAPAVSTLNSADRSLKEVRSWVFVQSAVDQRQTPTDFSAEKDFPAQIVDHARYPYDMIVTMLRSGPWGDQEHWTDAFLDADKIRAWQNSTAEGKIVIAQVNAAALSASHYLNGVPMSARKYWTTADGSPTAEAPNWLLCANGAYSGLNFTAYWHADWKKHVLKEVEHAIVIGANGVFLDEFSATIDQLKSNPACAAGKAAGIDLELEMLRLAQEVRQFVKSKNLSRKFYIIGGDGQAVFNKYKDVVNVIDGVLTEHMYFVGWTLPDFMNGPEQSWRTESSVAYMNAIAAKGLPIFNLEYVTEPAKIARLAALASTIRFTPAVSETKILLVSKPANLLRCDKKTCSNNGIHLANRSIEMPVEERFFDVLEASFAHLFYPAGRITQETDEFVYRHYPSTGKYVGFRKSNRAATYYDPANSVLLEQGTVESWANGAR